MRKSLIFCLALVTIMIVSCKSKSTTSDDKIGATTATNTTPISEKAAEGSTPAAMPIKIHETNGKLNWLEIQSALNHENKEGKMFFVDVYTDWCGWCKVMDKKTFSDPKVQEELNKRFHVVKFNAEQKNAIVYQNNTYDWVSMGKNGINMLAPYLLGEQMGFPSYVYLDKNKNRIKVSQGFMPVEQFLKELEAIQ